MAVPRPADIPVRILTLNCWGLVLVSKKRKERIAAIAKQLHETAGSYDVVCLQEVWAESDLEVITAAVHTELPHKKRWYSGIIAGPGLVVFSRWPIETAWLYRFALNGVPSAFWRGDWFVGKSAGSCTIVHPSGHRIEIVVAHLHAPYAKNGYNAYKCHRVSQAWDLSSIVRRSILAGRATFVVGDLNVKPGSVSYRLLSEVGLLSDAWVTLNGPEYESQAKLATLSPKDQIEVGGVTSDSQLNTWREKYPIYRAQRLDYVLFDAAAATPLDVKVKFTEPIPDVGSVSDHFAVAASFQLTGRERPHRASYTIGKKSDDDPDLFEDILVIIDAYRKTSLRRNNAKLASACVCITVLIGLLVTVWWAAQHGRAYTGFIYLIASIPLTVLATVLLLISLVFGRAEGRALTEFEHQIRLAQRAI